MVNLKSITPQIANNHIRTAIHCHKLEKIPLLILVLSVLGHKFYFQTIHQLFARPKHTYM